MPKQNVFVQSFNAGVVDKEHLARVDLERMRLAAEDQTNLIGTTTGNMFLRPGLGYLAHTRGDNQGWLKDFSISASSAALLEFTDSVLRVMVGDEFVTRNAVSTTVNNGSFGNTGDWVLAASDGASSVIASDRLTMSADAIGSNATARQEVSVIFADRNDEHALRIRVSRGPVTFRCGSSNGADDYIEETELKSGSHSLAFTPTGSSFWVFFKTTSETQVRVTECQIEDAGVMTISTPWTLSKLPDLRMAQSADVMFVACNANTEPKRIERRGNHSWSVVDYLTNDGPFMLTRSAPLRLKPNDLRGNTTMTASDNFFRPGHVGAIFRMFHNGQMIDQTVAGDQCWTDAIRVTGVSDEDSYLADDRDWKYSVSGVWAGTINCQRSVNGENVGFRKYRKNAGAEEDGSISSNVTDVDQYEDDDNSIVHYRAGFPNAYTSGTARIQITYDGGGGYGIARVTGYNSRTSVDVEVLKRFKNTNYTTDWLEGQWSDKREFPTAVALSEGRLFWAGQDKFWASVSDAFESFDEEIEGDSGPINRSIAIGGVNTVQWMLPLQRLVLGTNGLEVSVKSTSFDEPLSPTNLSLKSASSIGSANIDAVKVDGKGIFVDRTTRGLYELIYSTEANDYVAYELTRLCASFYSAGVVQIAVSRRPDTRVWAVLADGTMVCMVYEPLQQVIAFIPIVTDGEVESIAVAPGASQDQLYAIIKRTVDGDDVRFIEKMATDAQAKPGTLSRIMDAFVTGTNAPASATISGLDHLIGEEVKVWADGAPITEVVAGYTVPKLYTVDADGEITLSSAVTNYCVGLPYEGTFKSARLAYGAVGGTAMLQKKRVNEIGLVMSDYVRSGIRHGKDFDNLMPLTEQIQRIGPPNVNLGIVREEEAQTFAGEWSTDSRICLTAHWPANFMGLVFSIETNG